MDVVALVVGLVALVGAIVGSCFAQRMPAAVGWLSGGVGILAIGWAILNAGPLLPVLQAVTPGAVVLGFAGRSWGDKRWGDRRAIGR